MPSDIDKAINYPVNILPASAYEALPDYLRRFWPEVPEYLWHKEPDELWGLIKDKVTFKTRLSTIRRLRIQFWACMADAIKEARQMELDEVAEGICRLDQFHNLLRTIPAVLPWILTRSTSYLLKYEELAELSEDRLLEILSVSPVIGEGENQRVDFKLAKVQVDIFEIIQERLRGAVAQTINQKNLNVNVNANERSKKGVEDTLLRMEDILLKLKEVEEKRKALNAIAPIKLDTQLLMKPDKIKRDETR